MSKYTVTFNDVDGEQIGDLLAMVNENNRKYGRPKIPTPAITIEGDATPALGVTENGDLPIKTNADVRRSAPFWMVLRDGGSAPNYKHADVVSASKEAARICRESGCRTYVLAVEEEHVPHRMPAWEDVGKHADAHPHPVAAGGPHFGLWRVVGVGGMARIVGAVAGFNYQMFFTSDGGRTLFSGDESFMDAAWFPLDAKGKDINSDEIPF